MPKPKAERVRLRIGNVAKAVLITGQAYQDPKDALNEFVSNAADAYAEAGKRGERIRVVLRRKGRRPHIAVEDFGAGMAPERLRDVARNLFHSLKESDPRTIGEKGIGILAFQQLAARCDIVSRAEGSSDTFVLRLERGKAQASIERLPARAARSGAGTTVHLSDIDPDVLRVLTRRKVVDHLRARRGPALARGEYRIEVLEGRTPELVTPTEPDGIRLDIPPRSTLWGRIEFAVYVSPVPDRHRRVAVVGTGGVTIIDDLSELDEFSDEPWSTDRVSGMIVFEPLQQTAGRRAILRDREVFPVFVDTVRSVEPAVRRTLDRIAREVDRQTADRLAEAVRRIFGKVLRELDDVDNPMRTLVGSEAGQGGLLVQGEAPPDGVHDAGLIEAEIESRRAVSPSDQAIDLPADEPEEIPPRTPAGARPERGRARSLPSVAPDPSPDGVRSRYDPESRIVYYNDRHPDFLLVKQDERSLLEYLSTLVAKELVLYNNPRGAPNELAEEMVRMLVQVRRHLPAKR